MVQSMGSTSHGVTAVVRFEPHTLDVHVVLIEPKNRSRQFLGEVRRDQNDSNILGELIPMRFVPIEKLQQLASRIGTLAQFFEEGLEGAYRILERHLRHHRRITDGLQLHVPAVVPPLEFNDDEIGGLVYAQKVNAAPRVFPLGKLLSDHQNIRCDEADIHAE